MSIAEWIAQYGYWAVLVGCLLEGESVLLVAGFAAHQGHLQLPWVLLTAFAGGSLGDMFFYGLGRRYGRWLTVRLWRYRSRMRRVQGWVRRYDAWVIVAVRFLYGVRVLGPVAIGAGGFPWQRFVAFNLLGAAIWSCLIGGAGYVAGQSLSLWFGDVDQHEGWVIAGAVGVLVLVHLFQGWRARRRDLAEANN